MSENDNYIRMNDNEENISKKIKLACIAPLLRLKKLNL
jgi:tryptophanyl-tRNA synthetase